MRLMGQLNVTRAFGDAIYRPYITSEPEFSTYSFTTDDVLLVLATDGLWNVIYSFF
jgi:serine/threonine protein phosphatase PrpC